MHTFLVGAIFAVYFTAMAGLIGYACWTGREPRREEHAGETADCDPGPALIPAAARAPKAYRLSARSPRDQDLLPEGSRLHGYAADVLIRQVPVSDAHVQVGQGVQCGDKLRAGHGTYGIPVLPVASVSLTSSPA